MCTTPGSVMQLWSGDIAHRTWSNQKTVANRSRFIILIKKARNLVREAKRNYTHRLLDPKLPFKVLWRNLDEMGVTDSGGSDVIFSEELSNYYSSLGKDDAPVDRSQGASLATPADCGHHELFSVSNVTDREVFDAIRGIKSEAVGLDGIPIRFLRLILPSILPCVTHIFNTVLTCSIFPDAWKVSKILPIPKIPNPGELRDYRPISVLPSLSKALEVVMRDQMIRFIDGNRLSSPYQSG
jgi:hypothetical protein